MTDVETITPATRSVVAGAGTALGAAAIGGLAIALATDPALPLSASLSVGGVGLLLAASVAAGALRLIRTRGGLYLDRRKRRLGVGLTGATDVWWVSLDRVTGLRVGHVRHGGAEEGVWHCALRLDAATDLVLLETETRQEALDVAEAMARGADLEVLEDQAPGAPAAAATVDVRVTRGVALHGLLLLFGLSLVVVGVTLYLQVGEHPVFAILFAPLLGLLGACLVAIVVVKRLSREVLAHRGGLWTHTVFVAGRQLTQRTVAAAHPTWCLRVQPVRGARLELVGEDGVLVVGSGATTRSRADVETLAGLPGRFVSP